MRRLYVAGIREQGDPLPSLERQYAVHARTTREQHTRGFIMHCEHCRDGAADFRSQLE